MEPSILLYSSLSQTPANWIEMKMDFQPVLSDLGHERESGPIYYWLYVLQYLHTFNTDKQQSM